MKNNKSINITILYFSFLFVIFLCFPINRIFGIEVSLPGLSSNATLPQYIIYFFYFGISSAGVLSLVSFTIGAIGFMVSYSKPEAASNAKDRMKGAVLGLVLTLVSFIILRTINPILISPSLTPLEQEMVGVFYTGELGTAPAPFTNSNTFDVLNQGYVDIIYKCVADGYSPPLLIWKFPNPGLENGNGDLSAVSVVKKNCGETEAIPPGSFKMALETPGVYYCLGGCDGDMCSGYMSYANTATQNEIDNLFAYNIGGVRIVNSSADKLYYGTIFHLGGAEGVGDCSPFLMNPTSESKCLPNTNPIISGSVDIFKINLEPVSSGDGVSFYSEPYGWNKGARAGYWILSGQDIADIVVAGVPLIIQDYNYTNIDRPSGYPIYCKSFQSCPGSIKINGKYLVVLYAVVYPDGSGYCQKFTEDVSNLNVQKISRYINYIVIVPIK